MIPCIVFKYIFILDITFATTCKELWLGALISCRLKDWKRCHDGRRKKEMRKEEVARREEGPLE